MNIKNNIYIPTLDFISFKIFNKNSEYYFEPLARNNYNKDIVDTYNLGDIYQFIFKKILEIGGAILIFQSNIWNHNNNLIALTIFMVVVACFFFFTDIKNKIIKLNQGIELI